MRNLMVIGQVGISAGLLALSLVAVADPEKAEDTAKS